MCVKVISGLKMPTIKLAVNPLMTDIWAQTIYHFKARYELSKYVKTHHASLQVVCGTGPHIAHCGEFAYLTVTEIDYNK